MRKWLLCLGVLLCLNYLGCETENIEEKYYQQEEESDTEEEEGNEEDNEPVDTTNIPEINYPRGEIAWFPLNGNLEDSTGNNIPLIFMGTPSYVLGLNEEHGKGVHLDGASCMMVNLGFYDTLAIVFWIKGDAEIGITNQPVLFDYGLNALSAYLDGATGATMVGFTKNGNEASSEESDIEYLNSFCRYSFVYIEAGGSQVRIHYKGYSSDGIELVYHEDFDFPGRIDPQTEMLYIGRSALRENQENTYFKGAIDEIHIYSHPLTDQEIESMAFTHTQ
jgi:hypothetical protein